MSQSSFARWGRRAGLTALTAVSGWASAFGLRNDFSRTETNLEAPEGVFSVEAPDYMNPEKGKRYFFANYENLLPITNLAITALDAKGDTLWEGQLLNQSGSSPASIFDKGNATEIRVNNMDTDSLVQVFRPGENPTIRLPHLDASKPVAIYIVGDLFPHVEPSVYGDMDEVGPMGKAIRAFNDLVLTASQNKIAESIEENYGENRLVLRNRSTEELIAIADALTAQFGDKAPPVHVFVHGHHTAYEADVNGLRNGSYSLGEHQNLMDSDLANMIDHLPGGGANTTLLNMGCDVAPDQFSRVGRTIILAQQNNFAYTSPGLLGEVHSPAERIIPLIAQGADEATLQQALDPETNPQVAAQMRANRRAQKLDSMGINPTFGAFDFSGIAPAPPIVFSSLNLPAKTR